MRHVRTEAESSSQSPAQTISNAMVGLLSRRTGRGPTHARTSFGADFVLVSLHEALTRAEQNLVDAGEPGVVLGMRRTFSGIIRGEAIELVERVVRRPVESMLSDVDPGAGVAVMVFLLGRAPGPGEVEPFR